MTTALTVIAMLAAAAPPAIAPERVVFHTVAGDLVFSVDPAAAPQTAAQFLRLARAGVYDGTAFVRLIPGFVAQLSTAQDRARPLTPEQSALIHKLPLETSGMKHIRGVLSMAHADGDPNGGETSFCILLGAAPQLDGKYTAFGKLEAGGDVLTQLLSVPRSPENVPTTRLRVLSAQVFDTPAALAGAHLVAAHPVPGVNPATVDGPREQMLAAGLAAIIALAAAGALLRRRLSPKLTGSLNLVVLLIGAFLLFALVMPANQLGQHRGWLSAALFFGLIGTFRALGRFETAPEPATPGKG